MSSKAVRFCLGLLLFLQPVSMLRAQTVDEALATLNKQYPDEKAQLHLDKDFYVIGETIHFKAYLFGNTLPNLGSTRFYIQLFDKRCTQLSEQMFPVSGATVTGSLTLSDSLAAGNYMIRAFTPWMLNAGESFLFHQPVKVIDPKVKSGASNPPSGGSQISMQFFPESGNMIDGVVCAVAFTATNANGSPASVEGNIVMEDGTMISSLKTTYGGMGRTQFKPIAGNKYFAEVEIGGKPVRFPLPEVKASGVNIKVMDEKGGKMFMLARTEKDKKEFENLHLVVVQHKLIVFETDVTFEDYPSVRGHLMTENLPTGILQFVLLGKNNAPLAQRLSYVNNENYSSNISLATPVYSNDKRGKNTFEISFPDSLQRSISVSVTDADIAVPGKETIFSRFLLTNELAADINNPDWYFSSPADSVKGPIDLLMMTHGWARYSWDKITKGEFSPITTKDPGLLKVSGTVTDTKDKAPVKGGTLTLFITAPNQTPANFEVKVDDQGRFDLDSLLLFGKNKVSYMYMTAKGKPQTVTVIPQETTALKTAPGAAELRNMKQDLQAEPAAYNQAFAQFMQLKTPEELAASNPATATSGKDSEKKDSLSTDKRYAQGPFTKEARTSFDFLADPPKNKNQNLVDFVRQNVPQVQYSNGGFVSKKNFSIQGGQAWPVTIYLDNSVSNASTVQGLMVTDIALIKFYETGFFGAGTSASGGTIAVFTKKGADAGRELSTGTDLPFFEVEGFSVAKELYQPDYAQKSTVVESDHRATLYWNPAILTEGNTRKFSFDFYNNDITKKFRIVVEGFDATGKLIHFEKILTGPRAF